MWHKLITTFFIGQVAFEQAAEVSKKQLEVAREKAKDYKEKAEEYKNKNVIGKFETFAKEKVAHLRSCSEPFENSCTIVAKFLGDTADLKSKLASETNA